MKITARLLTLLLLVLTVVTHAESYTEDHSEAARRLSELTSQAHFLRRPIDAEISEPIQTSNAYLFLKLNDKREIIEKFQGEMGEDQLIDVDSEIKEESEVIKTAKVESNLDAIDSSSNTEDIEVKENKELLGGYRLSVQNSIYDMSLIHQLDTFNACLADTNFMIGEKV